MVRAINDGGEAHSIADFAVLEPTPDRYVEVVHTIVHDDKINQVINFPYFLYFPFHVFTNYFTMNNI